jgi:hypothetical protein
VAIALAADRFWKAGRTTQLIKELVSIKCNWRRRVFIVRFAPFRNLSRKLGQEIGSIKRRHSAFVVRVGTFQALTRIAVVAVVVVLAAQVMAGWASDVRQDVREKRGLAYDGVNFTSFYAHPDLRALAATNPDFDTYGRDRAAIRPDISPARGDQVCSPRSRMPTARNR